MIYIIALHWQPFRKMYLDDWLVYSYVYYQNFGAYNVVNSKYIFLSFKPTLTGTEVNWNKTAAQKYCTNKIRDTNAFKECSTIKGVDWNNFYDMCWNDILVSQCKLHHRHEYQFKRIILVRPDRRLSSTELDCSGSASLNFADHKKAIRPRVQSGEVEIISS